MILRTVYSIVEEVKRATAGKPMAETEKIRQDALRKIRAICGIAPRNNQK